VQYLDRKTSGAMAHQYQYDEERRINGGADTCKLEKNAGLIVYETPPFGSKWR
jgi:hypothetical protein